MHMVSVVRLDGVAGDDRKSGGGVRSEAATTLQQRGEEHGVERHKAKLTVWTTSSETL